MLENSIRIKDGVKFKEINKYTLEFFMALDYCCKRFNRSYVITSANNGKHSKESYHYKDLAWDIRLKDLPKAHWHVLRDALKSALGKYFDIIIESPDHPTNCHIHAECDANKLADWMLEQDHAD